MTTHPYYGRQGRRTSQGYKFFHVFEHNDEYVLVQASTKEKAEAILARAIETNTVAYQPRGTDFFTNANWNRS